MKASIRTAGVTLAALLATACAACTASAPQEPQAGSSAKPAWLGEIRLVAYQSCDDMLAELREKTAANIGPWGFGGVHLLERALPDTAKSEARADFLSANQEADHSTTNVHEAGADEPDLVKTDGKRIVTVSGGVLRVTDAATKKVTGSLRLVPKEHGYAPADLLMYGDRAFVRLPMTGLAANATDDARVRPDWRPGTTYTLVDLSGPQPKKAGSIIADGDHVDTRMVGSAVRIVVSSKPDIRLPFDDTAGGTPPSERELTERNRAAVRAAPIEAWQPRYEIIGADGSRHAERVGCERISHPKEYTGTSMLTVHTLDLAAGDGTLSGDRPVSVAADGNTVYGTASSLYVTSDPQAWLPMPIEEPPAVPDTLTPQA
ncbi:beta-propeller domain-containing protein, partial [Spongiactinospora gelatinilytica]|uniref:beta-propeller domain-containing protein n=1 Tax=Spongiactinospora gelatinilytica TaxID=2666298 RepID=UPI0018F4D83E